MSAIADSTLSGSTLTSSTITVATFNVNGIKARLPRLIEWLDETRPDVACLQEIKTQDDGFPAADLAAIGYQAIWHGQKGFNGVAILARGHAPLEVQRGLAGEPEDEQARYLEADVLGLRVACIYLPNGNPQPGPKFDYKLRWMDRLAARMAAISAQEIPAVVIGDYNVVPTDRDIWDTRAMAGDALMQPQSRAALRRMQHVGWTDALGLHNPRGGVWTYWDYQAGAWPRDHGFRIDHALLSPELADRLHSAGVNKTFRGREKASDHAPVWIRVTR